MGKGRNKKKRGHDAAASGSQPPPAKKANKGSNSQNNKGNTNSVDVGSGVKQSGNAPHISPAASKHNKASGSSANLQPKNAKQDNNGHPTKGNAVNAQDGNMQVGSGSAPRHGKIKQPAQSSSTVAAKSCPPECNCAGVRRQIHNAWVLFRHVLSDKDLDRRVGIARKCATKHAEKIAGTSFPFMRMARENRDQVYELAISDRSPLPFVQDDYSCIRITPRRRGHDVRNLLLASPQIFGEAMGFVLTNLPFIMNPKECSPSRDPQSGRVSLFTIDSKWKETEGLARMNISWKSAEVLSTWYAPYASGWALKFDGSRYGGYGLFPGHHIEYPPESDPPALGRADRQALNEDYLSDAFLMCQKFSNFAANNSQNIKCIDIAFGVDFKTVSGNKPPKSKKQRGPAYGEASGFSVPYPDFQKLHFEDATRPLLSLANIPSITIGAESLELDFEHRFHEYCSKFKDVAEPLKKSIQRRGVPNGNIGQLVDNLTRFRESFEPQFSTTLLQVSPYAFHPLQPVDFYMRAIQHALDLDNGEYRASILAFRTRALLCMNERFDKIRDAKIAYDEDPKSENLKSWFLAFAPEHDLTTQEPTAREDETKPMDRAAELKKLLMEEAKVSVNDYLCGAIKRRVVKDMEKQFADLERNFEACNNDTDVFNSIVSDDSPPQKSLIPDYVKNPINLSRASPREVTIVWMEYLLHNFMKNRSDNAVKPLAKAAGAEFTPDDFAEIKKNHEQQLVDAGWAIRG